MSPAREGAATPPFEPMLARPVAELPRGDDLLYEPKWDGFRAIAERDANRVELWSRHARPLARYFPELVEAIRELDPPDERLILDGEILVRNARGRFDFAALLARLHPAPSRVARLRIETPATYVAFDLVVAGDRDLTAEPFVRRRRRLERLLRHARPPLRLTPVTDDVETATTWLERPGAGLDGVVAKRSDLPYRPGERVMLKAKREHTADCLVAGYRWLVDRPAIGSLLLGLYDDRGDLRHVGVVSAFTEASRSRFLEELAPLAIPLSEHPWAEGFLIERSPLGRLKGAAGRWTPDMVHDWVPIRLERVAEVAYDRFDGDRFRHPARFLRWRPDRDPRSCTFGQLAVDERDLANVLRSAG